MRYYLLTGTCLLLYFHCNAQSISPQVVATSGNTTQNGSVILEQTIGEPLTTSQSAGSNLLTQGFHQPAVTAVGIDEWTQANVTLFPNPSVDYAEIHVPSLVYTEYAVYDASGRLVAQNPLESDQFIINIQNYESGVYKLMLKGKIETILTFIKL
jgi:hypothetical protein